MAKLLMVKKSTQVKDPDVVEDISSASEKDELEANDWVLCMTVLDRFFLLCYVCLNILATTIIFVQYSNN